jgi:hypothetical protein
MSNSPDRADFWARALLGGSIVFAAVSVALLTLV